MTFAASTPRSRTKAKSRLTGWRSESTSGGRVLVALARGSGMASRMISKPASGPSTSSASSVLGWNSPNQPMMFFGPRRMVPERPGWNQAGAPATTCTLSGRQAEPVEGGERVGLGVEDADRRRLARPVAAAAGDARGAAADAARGDHLVLGPVAAIDLADLEEGEVVVAAVGIALGGGEQAGQEARPHVAHVGGDRVGEHQLRAAARRRPRPRRGR